MANTLLSRRRDLIYLVYFTIGIPITLIVDLQHIYPDSWIPSWAQAITDFYIDTYHDQFFTKPPPFFTAYIWAEGLFQLPAMIWSWNALYHNSPKLPLVLLPFSLMVLFTTATCMVEYMFWPVPLSDKINLTSLYGPYLALSAFMFIDMIFRLNKVIDRAALAPSITSQKKKR